MVVMSDEHQNGLSDESLVEHDQTIAYEPLTAEPAESGGEVAGAFRYALVVEDGPRAGLTYVLGDGATLAGRSDDVDIFLRVEDLGSTNGIYVNMTRLDSSPLRPGDRLIIGKFHLAVAGGDA